MENPNQQRVGVSQLQCGKATASSLAAWLESIPQSELPVDVIDFDVQGAEHEMF